MPENVGIALDIMWKGMLGIFVVIMLVMLCTFLISYIGNHLDDRNQSKTISEPSNE